MEDVMTAAEVRERQVEAAERLEDGLIRYIDALFMLLHKEEDPQREAAGLAISNAFANS